MESLSAFRRVGPEGVLTYSVPTAAERLLKA
jgi:delta-aminolevulinic acid dehydratase/porphobilinogen synthase